MYLIDVAAYNSFVCYSIKHPDYLKHNEKVKRRQSIIELGHEIVEPLLKKRAEKIIATNFNGIQNSLVEKISKAGIDLRGPKTKASSLIIENETKNNEKIRKRCHICVKESEKGDPAKENKYSNVCRLCERNFCEKHCIKTIICHDC